MNTYENGPEGMPRVERMTDSTIDWVIHGCKTDGLIRDASGHWQLRDIAHAVAEEVLARLPAWPTPSPGTGTTASAAGTAVKMPRPAGYLYEQTFDGHTSTAFTMITIAQPGQDNRRAVFTQEQVAALAEEARREARRETDKFYAPLIADLRAQLAAAQRTAGGEYGEYDECPKCAGSSVRGEIRGVRCSTCDGSALVPVAEAAAQADDADWMGKIPHAFSNFAAPTAQPLVEPVYLAGSPCRIGNLTVTGMAQPTPIAGGPGYGTPGSSIYGRGGQAQPTPPNDERAAFEKMTLAEGYEIKRSTEYPNEYHFATTQTLRRWWEAGHRAALRQPGALPDWITLDGDATIIHGVRYSNRLLEDFGHALPAGQPFLIEAREKDGALTVVKLDWSVVDRPGALPDEAEDAARYELLATVGWNRNVWWHVGGPDEIHNLGEGAKVYVQRPARAAAAKDAAKQAGKEE